MTYVPAATDRYRFIRGVGWFSFSNYKLQPRYNPDIGLDVDKPTISKNAPVLVAPGGLFTYTVTVKNELGYPLTGLVIQFQTAPKLEEIATLHGWRTIVLPRHDGFALIWMTCLTWLLLFGPKLLGSLLVMSRPDERRGFGGAGKSYRKTINIY